MNAIWQRNYDDDVLVLATSGTQVASLARRDGQPAVPGAMTEVAFSTDAGMLQAILDRTITATADKGEPDVRVTRFIRTMGFGPRRADGGRVFMDHGVFVNPVEDENDVAARAMDELAERLRTA